MKIFLDVLGLKKKEYQINFDIKIALNLTTNANNTVGLKILI